MKCQLPEMCTSAHDTETVLFSSVHPLLMQLLDLKINRPVIGYIVHCVSGTVDHAMGRSGVRSSDNAAFTSFVSTVLARSHATIATVLTSLGYISRARSYLSISSNEWVLERVFLGALIVASKYTSDSTLKNVHWSACTGIFSTRDIGKIEREFLAVLDWELRVSEANLLAHHDGLVSATSSSNSARNYIRSHFKAPSAKTAPQPKPPQLVHSAITHSHHASPLSEFDFVPELDPSMMHSPSSEMSVSPRTPRSTSPSRSSSVASRRAPHHPNPSPDPHPRACTPDVSVHVVAVDVNVESPTCSIPAPRGRSRHRGFAISVEA
ncbi:hypothetical protein C8F04DRAFT_1039995 [Mycena alexandri]|uniref:Cyclin N-terminal domain-containing protein n=1 Tax=Mycena alexandri TaxID=1745969 RepID=A0AAD6SRV7_9AGAR|nr:hypothetical protein C8F04DRAFT_1039995 [Mycena alexandri]